MKKDSGGVDFTDFTNGWGESKFEVAEVQINGQHAGIIQRSSSLSVQHFNIVKNVQSAHRAGTEERNGYWLGAPVKSNYVQ